MVMASNEIHPGEQVEAAGGSREPNPPVRDVWSRREWRYRARAAFFILLNLSLFCGLCIFCFWLREARLLDFSISSYFAPARFWAANSPSLDDFLLEPISVERTPIHAVVLGLLFGALVTVPISIAILYRFPTSLPFLAAVFVFAHMPWLTFTLLCSCILAATRPFQLRFRYGAALMGLIPVTFYFYMASGRSGEAVSASSPTLQTLLVSPWLLAIVAAAAMLAVILEFARLVNYRPGTVAPAVAVMFAAPLAVFHAGVGVDELDYRVLELKYGPHAPRFAPVMNAEPMLIGLVRQIVSEPALVRRYQADLLALSRGESLREPRRLVNYFVLEFLSQRAEAYDGLRRFIHDHPNSPHLTEALYLQARILDMRLDESRMLASRPTRELYSDFPHRQSEPIWEVLRERSEARLELRAVAGLRLAQLALREEKTERAERLLREALSLREIEIVGSSRNRGHVSTDPLGLELAPILHEAELLLDLVIHNRNDPKFGARPLAELSRLDPRRSGYRASLLRLLARYPEASAADNILLRYVESTPDPVERLAALERLAPRLEDGDARAACEFAVAAGRLRSADPGERARAFEGLRGVSQRAGERVWGRAARDLLRIYSAADVNESAVR